MSPVLIAVLFVLFMLSFLVLFVSINSVALFSTTICNYYIGIEMRKVKYYLQLFLGSTIRECFQVSEREKRLDGISSR